MRSLAAAPTADPRSTPVDLAGAYAAWLAATGRGSRSYHDAARRFVTRWPAPQAWADRPLTERLFADSLTRPFLTFLMLHGHLRPGYDWLARRKILHLGRYAAHSPLADDLARYQAAAAEVGFSAHIVKRSAERVVLRLLIQTARPLDALTVDDLHAIEAAFRGRGDEPGADWRNDRGLLHAAHAVLFHLGILDTPAPNRRRRHHDGHAHRFGDSPAQLRAVFAAYLDRLVGIKAPSTVQGIGIRLGHFGRHLAATDPTIASLAALDRRRHIEPYLSAVARATRSYDGQRISVGEQRSRILTLGRFLADIAEWGWAEAPDRKLIFSRDVPRRSRPLPRYLPPDADRKLAATLEASPNRLFADALLLARATGLRIGELVDLELDCVHEIPGSGAWLKVPLGKLDSERMVPLDDDTLALIDRIVATRSPGQPLPHPRTGRWCEFLLTRHGKRISTQTLRDELARAAQAAGIGHVTPHQLRHTYATVLVNSGVSLQALMALLGHVSAAMSLRYGRLFDATVRADYERALALAKTRLGPMLPAPAAALPLVDLPGAPSDWRDADAVKARMAGGYCLRAAAQGVCPYTNICEHCPSYRTDATFLPILAAQRADAAALADDAAARGWHQEAVRHRDLIDRLDVLMSQADSA
jgi:integrase